MHADAHPIADEVFKRMRPGSDGRPELGHEQAAAISEILSTLDGDTLVQAVTTLVRVAMMLEEQAHAPLAATRLLDVADRETPRLSSMARRTSPRSSSPSRSTLEKRAPMQDAPRPADTIAAFALLPRRKIR